MIQLSRWKIILLALSLVFGLLMAFPNVLSPEQRAKLPGFVPKSALNLGLDLQGGSYLLLEVDVPAMQAKRVESMMEDVRETLRTDQIAFSGIQREDAGAVVTLTNPGQTDAAVKALRKLVQGQPGQAADRVVTSLGGGRIRYGYTEAAVRSLAPTAVDQSIEVVRRRIDSLGTREPSITRQGADRIVVQAPGESDPAALERVIGQTAQLTFQMVDTENSVQQALAGVVPPDSEIMMGSDGVTPYLIKKRVIVTGDSLVPDRTNVTSDQSGRPAIGFAFNGVGAKRFGDATVANQGKPFAIVLDGKVISAPRINTPILNGQGIIEGGFGLEEASEMVNLLKGGALPAPLKVEERRVVTAGLGADAVKAGALSTAIGFVIIVVFMLLAYGGLFGGISVLGLVLNGLLIVACMSLTQASLTLPGIAGLILTFAVAVDANVLIYERMRDEVRAGRSVIASMDAGFSKAWGTILDANVTTLVAAAIMFVFGAGPVRGFAWTLSIGVFTSVLSSVLVSQVLLGWWLKATKPKALPIADGVRPKIWPLIKALPQTTNFHFVKYARYAGVLSVVLCLVAIGSCFMPGMKMGIDFRGGASMEVSKPAGQVIQLDDVRRAVSELDLGDVQVQGIARRDNNQLDGSTATLTFQVPKNANQTQVVQRVETAINQAVGQVSYSGVTVVGSKVSGELFTSGLLALGAAIALMFAYIWFRFEPQFGFGAVAGLLHDVILTFGLIVLFRLEFSLTMVAAILTVIGYSMNDTVVVFDRLRENLRKYKSMPLRDVIDLSINETLSRTIITGLTAVMVLAALAFYGGEALFGFSIALMFGIIVGTYSSIYVGAPIILLWGVKRGEISEDAKPIKLGMASRP